MRHPVLAPIEPPFSPEVAAALATMMPVRDPVPPLALFRTLAVNLPLAEAMRGLAGHVLGTSSAAGLDRRDRELVIHRVCARCGCGYEWGVHAAAYGPRVGLSPAQLEASTMAGAGHPAWTDRDRLLIRLVDELHDTAHVTDGLWSELAEHWTPAQVVELLVVAGWYHAIAYVANATRLPDEPWAPTMPR